MDKTQEAIKLLAEANGMTVVSKQKRKREWSVFDDNHAFGYRIRPRGVSGYITGRIASEVDAQLIAAAPDLLEAAEQADKLLDNMSVYCHGHDSHLALKRAIAKAKGIDNE